MMGSTNTANAIDLKLKHFIINKKHPCIMTNSVFKMDNYHLKVYDKLQTDENIKSILSEIENYIKNYDFESNDFESLILCFKDDKFETEKQFESALWDFL